MSNQQHPSKPRFDPSTDSVPYGEMLEIDRWALARTALLIRRCRKAYEEYQFHQVYNALYNFCTVDMSSFYFDILKDRLYTHGTFSPSRRSAQTALWHILDSFTRLLAPILAFTAEEIWQDRGQGDSVHVQLFPEYNEKHFNQELIDDWQEIMTVREAVSKALEEMRQAKTIGNALEAKVVLHAGSTLARLLQRRAEDLRYIFIVSQAEVVENPSVEGSAFHVEVARAEGEKCERCWNYSVKVGKDLALPTLCERCVPVVRDIMQ